jgi:hypothetical protein
VSSIKPFFALVIDAGAKESYKPFIPIKYFKPSLRLTCDATTFSVTALDKTTFSLMTFSKISLGIIIFSKMTFSMIFSKMTFTK